ncbi:MAG: PP2C family protein-serine/threonine phosphatase [Acidobacteriota bacterium]|nr:PP2C family protein-serine/threonine phosphatase [Acidobacteriota bacterium]MDH3524907.1 PP2C family protein-serine/threonine phosphatase [Acidobacteriota bacterium]
MSKARRYVQQTTTFLRDYTAGADADQFRRLFDRDVADAYEILARDRDDEEPAEGFARLLYRAKVLFLGLSYKLAPARRVIFALSLILALLGLVDDDPVQLSGDQLSISLDFSPLFFLASIAGLILVLTMELVDRIRVRDELEIARQLQRDLLPDRVPEVAGYSVAHSYRTANTIGGDYYDLLPTPDGRIAVVVGDASGHGIAAGLLMAIANATLKTALDLDPRPPAVIALLNRALYRTGDRRAFMTFFYGLLDPASGELDYACAGHPFPLLRRAGGGVEELGVGQLPLGMRPELDVGADRTRLHDGDLLMLFSDGLPEAVGRNGEAFGFERLRRLLADVGSPQTIHDRVLMAFDQHRGGEPLTDDVTLLVLTRRLTPPPPPSPSASRT